MENLSIIFIALSRNTKKLYIDKENYSTDARFIHKCKKA